MLQMCFELLQINGGPSSDNAHTIADKLIEVLDSSCSI
jgi:hypothetical protein